MRLSPFGGLPPFWGLPPFRGDREAYYRKLKLSRIMLRDLASMGQIPGMVKSSW